MSRILKSAWLTFGSLAVLVLALGLARFAPDVFRAGYSRVMPGGFLVTYYRGTNMDDPICRRGELAAFRNYGVKRPAFRVPANHFSAVWIGFILAPSNALYSFYSQSMDGIRVYIDGKMLIDNWNDNEWISSGTHAKLSLTEGPHHIRIEHYNAAGPAAIRLRWTGGGIPANTLLAYPWVRKRIPAKWLSNSSNGDVDHE